MSKPSTDFIRAANPAQAAVYSISQTNSDKPGELEKAEIKRKMVALATPLRKGVRGGGNAEKEGRRPRKSKVGPFLSAENDPELPLRAALKLMDMYPDTVSSQLRNEILEKIEAAQNHADEMAALTRPKREGKGEEKNSDSLRQLEDEIRQLEAEYTDLKRKTDAIINARTAQQFAEADESMASNASPLMQHTARKNAKDAPKSYYPGDLTSRLLGDDPDATTDFRNLMQDDASLLLEGDTPDISQLMAQTPMKLASSGNWERHPPAQVEHAPISTKPQHVPLASLRMRGPNARPAQPPPPRTPPRREEDSFDETLPAGYTFEAGGRDDSVEEPESMEEDVTAVLPKVHLSPTMVAREEPSEDLSPPRTTENLDTTVEEPSNETRDEESENDTSAMKLFTMKLWTLAGDVLRPGNDYDIGKGDGTEPVPSFAQTKAILKAIADEACSPGADVEEIHRVVTAILLLHLMSRDSGSVAPGEEFQAGMSDTKELLSKALDARGWKQEHGNKVIFKWVGKKLLKSEGGRRLKCNLD